MIQTHQITVQEFKDLTADKFEHRSILIKADDDSKQLELVSYLDRIGKVVSHYEVGKPNEAHPFKTAFIQSAITFYNEFNP